MSVISVTATVKTMTMRTLTFGDRSISYDIGLNCMATQPGLTEQSRTRVLDSDESTSTPSSDRSDYSESICSDDRASDDGQDDGGTDPRLTRQGSRKLIKPDFSAISQLLNFDEEDEDELEEEDENTEAPVTAPSPTDWHKTVVKDLTSKSSERSLDRRHSITVCESPSRRKSSNSSSNSSSSSGSGMSSPKSSLSQQDSSFSNNSDSSPRYQLNTSQMHASLQDEFNSSDQWHKALQTLNLNLEEVAHIRSVLTKAELEGLPLDGNVKDNVLKGRICFLCMKTKFGIFSRGTKCDMCKQIICSKCQTKMRIPMEQFSATPVFTLSPINDYNANQTKDKLAKMGVPELAGINNTAGSAPSSPTPQRKNDNDCCGRDSVPNGRDSVSNGRDSPLIVDRITTISDSLPPPSLQPQPFEPVSLPIISNPYATLPKKSSRRWSMIQSRSVARERLEGTLLTVCFDCKEMVLQVIRTARTTKKMQVARSVFFGNISPHSNNYGQHRL